MTRVPLNAVALFPGGRGLVARLSWARLGHPRSPAPASALGVSDAVASSASSACVPTWLGGFTTEHRGGVGGRSRLGGTPYLDETVTAGSPRHYPVVPTHHPLDIRQEGTVDHRVPRSAELTEHPKLSDPTAILKANTNPLSGGAHVHLCDFPTHPAAHTAAHSEAHIAAHIAAHIGAHTVARVIVPIDINLAA